jgi:hypothetical protein
MPRNIPIQFRRGTDTEWNNQNPVLISGEPGFNSTNNILKIGDGNNTWSNISNFIPYASIGSGNYVSKWTNSYGLSTSIIYDNGSNIGIGTPSPTAKLHVIGSGIFASGINIPNQTASTIASFDSNKNITSLSTSTYPSLTELSYIKGVTSSIQAQINSAINSKTIAFFTARDNYPPAADYATFDTRNGILVLDFDDTADAEWAYFIGIIPEGANLSSGLDVIFNYTAATPSTVSGTGVMYSSFRPLNYDIDGIFTNPSGETLFVTPNATNGIPSVSASTHSSGELNGLTAGSPFILVIARDGNNGSDNMIGDLELISIEVRTVA